MFGVLAFIQLSIRFESKMLPFIGLSLDIFQGLKTVFKTQPHKDGWDGREGGRTPVCKRTLITKYMYK